MALLAYNVTDNSEYLCVTYLRCSLDVLFVDHVLVLHLLR